MKLKTFFIVFKELSFGIIWLHQVISGFKVASDMEGMKQHWLNLPATYTREELLADVEEVETRDNVAGWEHLKELVDKVPRKSDIEIGLLIGANCAKHYSHKKSYPVKMVDHLHLDFLWVGVFCRTFD